MFVLLQTKLRLAVLSQSSAINSAWAKIHDLTTAVTC